MTYDIVVKPIATAAVIFATDKFFINENDSNKSLRFAACYGRGAYLFKIVGTNLPDVLLTFLHVFVQQGLVQWVAKIGLGVTTFFVTHKYILKYFSYIVNIYNKIRAIAGNDIANKNIFDCIEGKPLSFLAKVFFQY